MTQYFINMLGPWQWAALAMVPPAIVALYFLKLKRVPLEVPSTYLWRKSIEDMHVNSIWQRLRQSLLLFLQLLLVFLAMLALLRPGWRGARMQDDRLIFLVDNSASMTATDVEPTRLDDAKRRVRQLIDQMESGSQAMIISFSNNAQVVQEFTDNRRLLRGRLETIQPTARTTTSMLESLQLAAGLANPGRSAVDTTDVAVADPLPASLYIFSDGKFDGIEGFSLGNLKPFFIPIGDPEVKNVAITAFSTRRHEVKPDHRQAFARLANFGNADVRLMVELYLDDELIDADEVTIAADGGSGVVFDLGEITSGRLRLQVRSDDALTLDNVAYASLNAPHRSRVLFISPGNEAVELTFATRRALELADVEIASPDVLKTKTYQQDASSGAYDLVIYDQCRPDEMPQANTLLIGRLPPIASWKGDQEPVRVEVPQIIDTDRTHPLMQLVDMNNVDIAESLVLDPPPGSTVLIESNQGKIAAIGPREGFEDLVLGFEIVGVDSSGQRYQNTNWPIGRASFPTFWFAVLEYLAGGGQADRTMVHRPGQPVQLSSQTPVDRIEIEAPDSQREDVLRGKEQRFQYHATDQLGIYQVYERGEIMQRFAVNLFSMAESDIAPQPDGFIQIGYVEVKGQVGWEPARRETWKILLLLALAVLLFEWYIYNRRVYI